MPHPLDVPYHAKLKAVAIAIYIDCLTDAEFHGEEYHFKTWQEQAEEIKRYASPGFVTSTYDEAPEYYFSFLAGGYT